MKKLLLAAGLVLLYGCAPIPPATPPENLEPERVTLTEEYRIGVGDVVRVNVWRNPDLDIEVPVRPDGMISVPLAGDVMAGGRTPNDVAVTVAERLSQYLRDPKVAVIPISMQSIQYISRIRVTGAVESPITIPYSQGITVLDAVLAAGGVTQFASPEKTRLYRTGSDGRIQVYPVNLRRLLEGGALESNFDLQPGDTITVPERGF